MSNYRAKCWNPATKKYEMADFMDNYFGGHKYGVRFDDGKIYPEEEVNVAKDIKEAYKPPSQTKPRFKVSGDGVLMKKLGSITYKGDEYVATNKGLFKNGKLVVLPSPKLGKAIHRKKLCIEKPQCLCMPPCKKDHKKEVDEAWGNKVDRGLDKVVYQNVFDKGGCTHCGRPRIYCRNCNQIIETKAKIKWKKESFGKGMSVYSSKDVPITIMGCQDWFYIKILTEFPSLKAAQEAAEKINNLLDK